MLYFSPTQFQIRIGQPDIFTDETGCRHGLDLADNGELAPAFDAVQFDSEERALRSARDLSRKHHGVIAWL